MNTDQIKGKLQDAIGHIKQGAGEAVGNDKVANEGLADQVKGSTRETWGNVRDAADTGTTTSRVDVADRTEDTASNTRSTLSEKLHEAKAAINDRIDEFKAEHNR